MDTVGDAGFGQTASRKKAKTGLIAHGNDRTGKAAFRFGNFVAEWSISLQQAISLQSLPPPSMQGFAFKMPACNDFHNSATINAPCMAGALERQRPALARVGQSPRERSIKTNHTA
jgi:hypothetical protein